MAEETTGLRILFPYAKDSFFTRLYQLYPASSYNSTVFQRQTIYGNYITGMPLPRMVIDETLMANTLADCVTYYMASAASDWGQPAWKLIFNAGSQLHGATRPFLHNTDPSSESNQSNRVERLLTWYHSDQQCNTSTHHEGLVCIICHSPRPQCAKLYWYTKAILASIQHSGSVQLHYHGCQLHDDGCDTGS